MAYSSCSTDLPPPPAGWREVLCGASAAEALFVTAAGGAWAVWVADPVAAGGDALDFSDPGNSRLLVEVLY